MNHVERKKLLAGLPTERFHALSVILGDDLAGRVKNMDKGRIVQVRCFQHPPCESKPHIVSWLRFNGRTNAGLFQQYFVSKRRLNASSRSLEANHLAGINPEDSRSLVAIHK